MKHKISAVVLTCIILLSGCVSPGEPGSSASKQVYGTLNLTGASLVFQDTSAIPDVTGNASKVLSTTGFYNSQGPILIWTTTNGTGNLSTAADIIATLGYTPADNSSVYVAIAAVNATARIDTLNGTVVTHTGQITSLNNTLVTLNGSFVTLNGTVVTLNQTLVNLSGNVSSMNATLNSHVANTTIHVPDPTGQSGKVLGNNGTHPIWVVDQTGNGTGVFVPYSGANASVFLGSYNISANYVSANVDGSNITGGSLNQTLISNGTRASWTTLLVGHISDFWTTLSNYVTTTVFNAHVNNTSNPHNVTVDQSVWNITPQTGYRLTWNGTNVVWSPPIETGFIYYLQTANASVTAFPTYRQMNFTFNTTASSINTTGVTNNQTLANFITAVNNPNTNALAAGTYSLHLDLTKDGGSQNLLVHGELWDVAANGTDIARIGMTENSTILVSGYQELDMEFTLPTEYVMNSTSDRLLVRLHGLTSGAGSPSNLTIWCGGLNDSHLSLPSSSIIINNLVPYTGSNQNVNLGTQNITVNTVNSSYYLGGTLNQTIISDGTRGSWTTLLVGHISDFWTQLTSYVTTRLAAFTGSTNITTVGTITTGTWNSTIVSGRITDSLGYTPLGANFTAVTAANITNALGYTPYNSSNVSGANISSTNNTVPTMFSVKTYSDNSAPIRITARLFANNITVTAQNDTAIFGITEDFGNSRNITALWAFLSTNSTSGNVTVQFFNLRSNVLVGSVLIPVNKGSSYDTGGVVTINTTNSGVQIGDRIRFDVIYAGTGAKGLQAGFRCTIP